MNEYVDSLTEPVQLIINQAILLFPNLVISILLLGVGWILGAIAGRVMKELLVRFKIDYYISKRTNMFKISDIFPVIIEWMFYLVFIQAAVQTLGITALVEFVDMILGFIPGLIEAIIIVILGYVFAEYVKNEFEKTKIAYSEFMSRIIFWLITYISVALALPLIGIDATIVNSILLIIMGSFGLGLAIAIGLGLKDVIRDIAKKKSKSLMK